MLNKDLKKQKGSPFFLTKNYKKKNWNKKPKRFISYHF